MQGYNRHMWCTSGTPDMCFHAHGMYILVRYLFVVPYIGIEKRSVMKDFVFTEAFVQDGNIMGSFMYYFLWRK